MPQVIKLVEGFRFGACLVIAGPAVLRLVEKLFGNNGTRRACACVFAIQTRAVRLISARRAPRVQGGAEKLGDEAIGVMLDKVVKLLAYLNDKDLFAEFYRKRLSRRLLQDRIVEHHEMQVLAQLKAQCGAQFTGKVRLSRAAACAQRGRDRTCGRLPAWRTRIASVRTGSPCCGALLARPTVVALLRKPLVCAG